MKKVFFLILYLVCLSHGFAQNEYVSIKGFIKETLKSGNEDAPIIGAKLILTGKDSLKLTTLSDKNGDYEFNLKRFDGLLTIHYEIAGYTPPKNDNRSCYFPDRSIRLINLKKSEPKNYIVDFTIQRNVPSIRMPELIFKENSLDFETDTLIVKDKPIETIRSLFEILRDNPTIIVEISAHCDSKEKNKDVLSLKRAELIKNILIKKGVHKERLKTKGHADKQPLIAEQIILKETSLKERNVLRSKNRRMNFMILSFDYGVKESDKKVLDDKDEE